MQEGFVVSGFGGQGVLFAGQTLAYAAMDEGYHVTWIPSYGPEMRGGTAYCVTVISDHLIGSPIVERPHVALVFNTPSFNKFEPLVAPGGILGYNTSLINKRSQRPDITQVAVPATKLASALGDGRMTNMVLLGAVLTLHPILTLEAIEKSLQNHLLARRPERMEGNRLALARGAEFARQLEATGEIKLNGIRAGR
jgi:2-oxoglutarate ferredoxin oxidoreductase subunit gamma